MLLVNNNTTQKNILQHKKHQRFSTKTLNKIAQKASRFTTKTLNEIAQKASITFMCRKKTLLLQKIFGIWSITKEW